jgi:hypothetical protein
VENWKKHGREKVWKREESIERGGNQINKKGCLRKRGRRKRKRKKKRAPKMGRSLRDEGGIKGKKREMKGAGGRHIPKMDGLQTPERKKKR